MNLRKRQQGLGFTGFIFGAFALVLVSIFGLKVLPVYLEHAKVDKLLSEVANDPNMKEASLREIRESYGKRASIDDVTIVKAADIAIEKSGGKPSLSASYSVKVPLAGNVSLYIEFNSASK